MSPNIPVPQMRPSSKASNPLIAESDSPPITPSVMTLRQFCDAMDSQPFLWNAELTKTCTYIDKNKHIAPHRCLVVDVCCGDNGHLWLRLDRRPTSRFALLSKKGQTPSNDSVTVARSARELNLENYNLENVQVFVDTPPTLRDLIRVLRAFSRGARKYRLWSENCWFLCSVVEDLLSQSGSSLYVAGDHRNGSLAVRSRSRIALHFVAHPRSSTTSTLLVASEDSPPTYQQSAFDHPDPTSLPPPTSHCTHRGFVEECATNIALYLRNFPRSRNPVEVATLARQLKGECMIMLRQVHWDAGDYANPTLAQHLLTYGLSLQQRNRQEEAVRAMLRSVEMTIVLHHRQPELHSDDLYKGCEMLVDMVDTSAFRDSTSNVYVEVTKVYEKLPNTKSIFYSSGSRDDSLPPLITRLYIAASAVKAESVARARLLYHEEPRKHASMLSRELWEYSKALSNAGSNKAARDAGAESVFIIRSLWQRFPERFASEFTQRLQEYSLFLSSVGLDEAAQDAEAESVSIVRSRYQKDPAKYASTLAWRLREYIDCLSNARLDDVILHTWPEYIAVLRSLYQQDPANNGLDLVEGLRDYSDFLFKAGLEEVAHSILTEAVAVACDTNEQNLEAHALEMASQIANRGWDLYERGSLLEACYAAAESVAIFRGIRQQYPDRHSSSFAAALNTYDCALYGLGQYKEACAAGAESVAIYRELHEQDPRPDSISRLAECLANYGNSLFASGLHQEARVVAVEVVGVTRTLREENSWDTKNLANSLHPFGHSLHLGGFYREACDVKAGSINLTEKLHALWPREYSDLLAERRGSYEESLRECQESKDEVKAATQDKSAEEVGK